MTRVWRMSIAWRGVTVAVCRYLSQSSETGGWSALTMLRHWWRRRPHVLVLSHGSIEVCVHMLKLGLYDQLVRNGHKDIGTYLSDPSIS